MTKRLWNVFVLTLAMNFLALAGGVGYLWSNGRLDRQKIQAIKQIVFPPPPPPIVPATQPADAGPATRPILKLEELLAQRAGLPAAEQLQHIRQSFDAQMAHLDRQQRALLDLQRQVELGQQQLARDRAALAQQQKKLDALAQEQARMATDKGFQDSLVLYQSMPPKQAKQLLMGLDDDTVVRYLQAMEPRSASKIAKEFKTTEESERLKKIMDKMRIAQAN